MTTADWGPSVNTPAAMGAHASSGSLASLDPLSTPAQAAPSMAGQASSMRPNPFSQSSQQGRGPASFNPWTQPAPAAVTSRPLSPSSGSTSHDGWMRTQPALESDIDRLAPALPEDQAQDLASGNAALELSDRLEQQSAGGSLVLPFSRLACASILKQACASATCWMLCRRRL